MQSAGLRTSLRYLDEFRLFACQFCGINIMPILPSRKFFVFCIQLYKPKAEKVSEKKQHVKL